MAVYKCKMCGGSIEVAEGQKVITCEYCGATQTVHSFDNEKKTTYFKRAETLRFRCEFDKAAGIYETIVSEFPREPEAYWGLILCKYGIEYVDDPKTGLKIPTCHRTRFESIYDDTDYNNVIKYADVVARDVYEKEAKEISKLQKSILDISSKEDPFDIFICYKENDSKGNRTKDSVLAQEIYDELVNKGYRVFFSRITLEDKLGTQYEPYIFAALRSAKIMLHVTTSDDNSESVWVRNEWSRFLSLIADGQKKTLIPCYKEITAYDLPEEMQNLQGQDMSKLGAMQDLLRGVEKILNKKTSVKVEKTIVEASGSFNVVNRQKEETLLVTTTSEVLPEEVNSELFVHTLFGWDFKQKKFYRSPIGSPYVTGYGLGGSCEMVQLTFERNMKAPWCTEELLKKEKEFFAVRAQYINEFMNQQKSNMTKPKVAAFPKPFRMGMIFLPIGATFLSFIFLLTGLTEPGALFLAFIPIPILLIAVAVEIFFAKQGGKVKRNRQAMFDEEFKESSKKLTELNNRMNEIAKWAGDHMEQKFGYKISPLAGETHA